MQTLFVELGAASYPILIGSGLLSNRELLDKHILGKDLLVVSDANVAKLYLARAG